MRIRTLLLPAVAAGTLLTGLATPASAECAPQLVEGGESCPNACDDEAQRWNDLNRRLGGTIGDYPFLCTT